MKLKKFNVMMVAVALTMILAFGVAIAAALDGMVSNTDKGAKSFTLTEDNGKAHQLSWENRKVGRKVKDGRKLSVVTEEKDGKQIVTKAKITKAAVGC